MSTLSESLGLLQVVSQLAVDLWMIAAERARCLFVPLLVCLVLAFSGCGSSASVELTVATHFVDRRGTAVVFEHKFDGPVGLPKLLFALDQEEFDVVWAELGRGQAMPVVDFDSNFVIAVETRYGPACDYQVDGAEIANNEFHVIELDFSHDGPAKAPNDCRTPEASPLVAVFTVELAEVESHRYVINTNGMAPNESLKVP